MDKGRRRAAWTIRSFGRIATIAVAFVLSLTVFSRGTESLASEDAHESTSFDSIFKELKNLRYPPAYEFYKVIQDKVPKSTPHPCDFSPDGPTRRSKTRPTSVHRLRPGDIDVIAAIGDSLTTANSARETHALGFHIQDRGVSISGGGVGTWREVTTLPNIIKNFNPHLVGYAIGRGDFLSINAQLNVAFPAALSEDTLSQVRLLIKKMRKDRRINYEEDWKLLTIFIGHNNICSYQCLDREKHSPRNHMLHLQRALDYLYKKVPRLFVNLVSILDPTISARISSSFVCGIFRRAFCACLYKTPSYRERIVNISSEARKYQEAEEELGLSGRYDGRDDFAVVFQPFPAILNGPLKVGEPEHPTMTKELKERLPIWTEDCFHLNQRGLATASILLWNNMIEPVGNKSKTWEEITLDVYKCPTEENPYFFTNKNSEKFYKEGHQ